MTDRAELPDRVPEIPHRRRHEDAVPVDEGHRPPVPEHGVAGRDVAVADDVPLRERLGTLLESRLRREALNTVVVGPQ